MNKKTTRFRLSVELPFKQSTAFGLLLYTYLFFVVSTLLNAQTVGCSGKLGKPLVTIDFGRGKGAVPQDSVKPIKPNVSAAYKFEKNPNGSLNMSDGHYCISNVANYIDPDWYKGADHTGDNLGRMMVVNANLTAGEFCRIRVDSLCKNTKFEFSAWIANIQSPNNGCGGQEIPINVKFQIEDLAGNIIASENTGDIKLDKKNMIWNRKAFMFDTKNNTSIQLVLKNNGNGGCGNDLALDDISFAPCGPDLSINTVASCSETDFTIAVQGADAVYPNPAFLWQYSTDNGKSWNSAPNGTTASIVGNFKNTSDTIMTVLYRVYAAGDPSAVRERCSVVSPIQKVLIYPLPKPSFTKSTPFCIGGDVYFEADLKSSAGKCSWTFENGVPATATTPKVTVKWLNAGTYKVSLVVTDINGCLNKANNATQDVIINGRPDVNVTPDKTALFCKDKQVTLSATDAGYKHQWKKDNANITGATTPTYNATTAGWYYDFITDAKGCTNKDSVLVAQADVFKGRVASSTDVSCHGKNDGEASISVINKDINNYSFKWEPIGGTGTSAANLPAGDYKVYLTDKATGCMDTVFFKITEPASDIKITPTAISPVKCNGNATGAAKVNVTGGTSPYTYEWTTTSGPIFHNYDTISNLTAQQYTVLVTDSKGCAFSRVIDIKQPNSALAARDSVKNLNCFENNNAFIKVIVSGGTPGYTYTWNTATAHKDSIQNPKPGKYTVLVTDLNHCTISRTIEVKGPSALLSDSLQYVKHVNCYEDRNGIAFVLPKGGTPSYTYLWSTGAKTDSIKNLDAGKYTVLITDKNGCTRIDSLVVKGPTAGIAIAITHTNLSCYKDSSAMATAMVTGGTPVYNYTWQTTPVQTTFTINNLKAGTYTLTVEDNNKCKKTESVTIMEPQFPPDEYTINANYCADDSTIVLHAEKGYAPYQWFENGKLIKGATADTLMIKEYKNKKITVTWFKNGCRHQSSDLQVTEPNKYFFPDGDNTTTIFTPNGDGHGDYFYPYASAYTSQIDYYAKEYNLQIFDRWGKLIFETSDYNKAWDGTYNTSTANAGVYYWMSTYVSRCGGGNKKVNNKGFVHLMK